MPSKTAKTSGFTLVEMLVVAPMIILILAGLIAVMINMVGDVMMSHQRGQLVANTQAALDRIESDVRLTGKLNTTTGALPAPQGESNTGGAFTSSNALILSIFLTTGNPIDRFNSLDLIYKANTPNSCNDPDPTRLYTYNEPFLGYVIYFVDNDTLWRRTIVPSPPTALCGDVWQRNSCAEGFVDTGRCVTRDEKVLEHISSMEIKYFYQPGDTAEVSPGNASMTRTVEVTLSTQKTVAGADITHSAILRATRLNSPVET